MNWQTLTLQQFQDIHRLALSNEDEMEKTIATICILHGMTEAQVDDLTLDKFTEIAQTCKFLLDEQVPGKPVRSFMVGAKKYAINYKPSTLKHRQYVEILHFSEKPIENMHNIMASLVQPVKFGFKIKNKVEHHAAIAEDMLNAPLLAVYHSCVFFCLLYRDLIERIRGYLVQEMMNKGATNKQANRLITDSISGMDGFIQQSR